MGGLNLLPGGQSVFPHYGPKWSSLVEAKHGELGHDVLVVNESDVLVNASSDLPGERPMIRAEVAPLLPVAKPFALDLGSPFALPTFVDSPSKLVPTAVPLAYELLIASHGGEALWSVGPSPEVYTVNSN